MSIFFLTFVSATKRKRDMKKVIVKDCVLYDSQESFEYEDYKEFCEEMELKVYPEDSADYWSFVEHERQNNWDDFNANMEFCKFKGQPCMITGQLGLWNRTPTIVPVLCDDIMAAIKKCLDNNFAFECEIILTDGHVNVNVHHHDGTNCFEIHLLSKKGEREVARPIYQWDKDYEPKRWWFKNIYGWLF